MFNEPRRDHPDSGQCPRCGTKLNGPVKFCPECGANQHAAASRAARNAAAHRSRTQYYVFGSAVVFALVFTAFGISHRNQRGQPPTAQAIQGSILARTAHPSGVQFRLGKASHNVFVRPGGHRKFSNADVANDIPFHASARGATRTRFV
jgi:hypothetical protein